MDLKYYFKSVINRELTHQYYVINAIKTFNRCPALVFLNVRHQRGCKLVTSGTSVKINVFFSSNVFTTFIHHCVASPVALLPLVGVWVQRPIVPGYDMLRPINRFSLLPVMYNWTIAVVQLRSIVKLWL